jgi:3D (Asp-Asp-Asp) domain-containing protein
MNKHKRWKMSRNVCIVIFLLSLWPQTASCQNESQTIGNFYREFLGSPAKIAARDSIMITNKYRQMLTDLDIDCNPLLSNFAEKIIDSPFQNMPLRPQIPTIITKKSQAKKYSKPKFKLETVKVTAYYTPVPNQKKYFCNTFEEERNRNGENKLTASGTKPRVGVTVATDKNVFKLGTTFKFTNPLTGKKEELTAEDTGGSVRGKQIDIYAGLGDIGYNRVLEIMRIGVITVKVFTVSA